MIPRALTAMSGITARGVAAETGAGHPVGVRERAVVLVAAAVAAGHEVVHWGGLGKVTLTWKMRVGKNYSWTVLTNCCNKLTTLCARHDNGRTASAAARRKRGGGVVLRQLHT